MKILSNETVFAMALTCVLAVGVPAPGIAADELVPVIVSTDTATGLEGGWRAGVSDIDDGLAVAMALASAKLDVRGVVVTWGNNLMEPQYAIATRVVAGIGAGIPVVRGAPRPLPEAAVTLYDGAAVDAACMNEGVRFMARQLAESETPVTILAIGPLTDIACLAINDADAAGRIDRVVVIGGRDPGEAFAINGHALSDFNLALDIPAVAYLLDKTTIRLRFMPFGLTSSVLVPAAERDVLCQSRLALAADFLCLAVVPWIAQWSKVFAEDGFHPWDQNAIYVTSDPAAYSCEAARYDLVDCAKRKCAGHDPADPKRLASESAQLWLSPDPSGTRIEMCRAYAPGSGKAAFEKAVFDFAR